MQGGGDGRAMDEERRQQIRMTETPVGSLVLSLAGPTVVSMLVTAFYNMADTYFISKLGTSQSAAVGIVFSIMALIQAVGFTIAMGAGSWISRLLGARKVDEANTVASSGFFAALLFGSLFSATGTIFLAPLMRLLGATETIQPHAEAYAKYILLAAPVMMASFLLNMVLRAEGKARFAMMGIATGGILNVLLDPLFIFTFRLGNAGAAIATALSQCVGFTILLSSFLRGRTVTKIALTNVSKRVGLYANILKFGFPSLCRQGLASVATVVLNVNAAAYGDAAVAAMSIVGKIFMFIFSMMLGIGQGYQPVAGYNYGSKHFSRVKEGFFFTAKLGTATLTSFAVLGFLTAPTLVRLFIADETVITIGARAFRAMCLALPLIPICVTTNMSYQSTGKAWTSTFLATFRQGLFFIPTILILPKYLNLTGVQIAQALADGATLLATLPFTIRFLRHLDEEEKMARQIPASMGQDVTGP